MTIKTIEELWHEYPESRLHCNVTKAGLNSYSVSASLISANGETLASVEHYGNGDLSEVKEQAYKLLAEEMQKTVQE